MGITTKKEGTTIIYGDEEVIKCCTNERLPVSESRLKVHAQLYADTSLCSNVIHAPKPPTLSKNNEYVVQLQPVGHSCMLFQGALLSCGQPSGATRKCMYSVYILEETNLNAKKLQLLYSGHTIHAIQ
jgi:hypothetical protein